MDAPEYTDEQIVERIKIALHNRNRKNPCLCGSGKKYKDCCRDMHKAKFAEYQRGQDK